MDSKNHHVLFGSAGTKWISEEEDQNRVGEKMCEKAPAVVESTRSLRWWTSGTSSSPAFT